jgi:serine protease Do
MLCAPIHPRRRTSVLRATILVACLAALCSCADGQARPADDEQAAASPESSDKLREPLGDVPEPDKHPARALSSSFRAAAERALPAVVSISVEREAPAENENVPDFFRFFFDAPPGGQPPQPRPSTGSGFIFKTDGHIITNAHVVEGASFLTVQLLDGREFDGKVVAADPNTDVAVIKIEPGEVRLPTATLGGSEDVRVGDWVLALGAPLGLDFTVTAGIVSAKGRAISNRPSALEAFIQTDAAINPGNSGGPLVDLDGQVIGINTLIYGGQTFVGYGFAIPIDLAQRVVRDLLEFGHVRRPRLGVQISDIDAVDAEAYGLDEVSGAEINSVEDDSPAEAAGLRPGDVVVALNGKPIADGTALTTGLAQLKPGDEVELTIIRSKSRKNVTVSLGEFQATATSAERGSAPESSHQTLGFGVTDLDRELAERLGIERDEGVVITRVRPGSSAQNAGIQEGQIVLAINGKPVRTSEDVERVADDISRGSVVSVRVDRSDGGETIINYRAR